MNSKDKFFWSKRENCYKLIGESRISSRNILSSVIGKIHYDELFDKYVWSSKFGVSRLTPTTIEIILEKLKQLNK